ncbi:hypothetical protein ACJX0J_016625, partial [Zea mays]
AIEFQINFKFGTEQIHHHHRAIEILKRTQKAIENDNLSPDFNVFRAVAEEEALWQTHDHFVMCCKTLVSVGKDGIAPFFTPQASSRVESARECLTINRNDTPQASSRVVHVGDFEDERLPDIHTICQCYNHTVIYSIPLYSLIV